MPYTSLYIEGGYYDFVVKTGRRNELLFPTAVVTGTRNFSSNRVGLVRANLLTRVDLFSPSVLSSVSSNGARVMCYGATLRQLRLEPCERSSERDQQNADNTSRSDACSLFFFLHHFLFCALCLQRKITLILSFHMFT